MEEPRLKDLQEQNAERGKREVSTERPYSKRGVNARERQVVKNKSGDKSGGGDMPLVSGECIFASLKKRQGTRFYITHILSTTLHHTLISQHPMLKIVGVV